jgi:CzcA family heavy metal efflux pump
MIDRIIQWSLTRRAWVVALAALLLALGGYRATQMPVDVFPDLTAPSVTVIAEAHGMAPGEVESLVTFPIETAMNGAAGVRRVRSSTGIGIAIVWVEFEDDVEIHRARQVVAEKLQLAQGQLPPDIAPPVLAPVSSIMGEILFLALASDRHSPMELKTAADWVVRPRLLAVAGVSQVVPTGGDTKQYQVIVHPERLASYRITLLEVVESLRRANESASAGFYSDGETEYLIHAVGRVGSLDDIAESVIAERGGEAVLVRHVADVREGAAIKRGEGSHDAKPAVILGVQKQPGTNTLELTKRLEGVLDDLQASLPEGMTIERHIFRQADFIETAIHNVRAALRDGAILVILIVGLFLASARATLITVVAMPLSLAVAILTLSAMGVTLNTMTLGGMAIAVGELVDDAIVDVENVVRRLRENARRAEAERRSAVDVVLDASREIRGSVVYATLVILIVFVPLFFLSGVEGRLLRPLALAYMLSLAASLVVALTVTPAMCSLLLPSIAAKGDGGDPRLVRWLRARYERMLDRVLPRWRTVAAVAVALLASAAAALAFSGRAFLPDFNEGTLTLSVVTLPGTSLAESDRIGRRVEQILLDQPEVTATARRTGRAELDEHAQDVNAAEIDVNLAMKGRSKQALLEALRREFSMLPGTNIVIGQPISHRIDHMLSGTRANIAVKIFGDDRMELRRLATEVQGVMAAVPGVVDLSIEQGADIPMLLVKLDRAAIARSGMRVGDVAETIETAFAGHAVSQVRERQRAFALVVRYPPEATADLETIRGTIVRSPRGAEIPLHALAELRDDRGPSTISRENVARKMVVQCNVGGRDLGGVVDDIRRGVAARIKLPPGYRVEYGGQFESASEASRRLIVFGAAALVAVFALLAAALGSARDAALVLVNLPLALAGGAAGVYLAGGTLSVASLVGFITLFGIATRNGLMLVSHVHHVMEVEGETDLAAAVRRGASERLAPILMTALAAGLALIPLALGGGEPGNEIQTPMAIVILCGLASSTLLNMVVLPALYLRFGALGRPPRPAT